MKLKALDQISISSVQSDSLRPGQEFAVSDALGAELLEKHPGKFEQLADDPASDEAAAPDEKAEGEPQNKKAAEPANKATRNPRAKAPSKAAE